MKITKDEAIVLRKRKYREKDEILILFSLAHGKLALMSYGSRDPKSRKAGVVELFNTVALESRQGKSSMPVLQQVKLIKSRGLGIVEGDETLQQFYRASEIVKMTDKYLQESQVSRPLYGDLNAALDLLSTPGIVSLFKVRLLQDLGFLPDWSVCSSCNEKLELNNEIFFDQPHNGFAHRHCVNDLGQKNVVGADLLKVMSYFQKATFRQAVNVEISESLLEKIEQVLGQIRVEEGI